MQRLLFVLAGSVLALLSSARVEALSVFSTFEDLTVPAQGFFFPAAKTTFTSGAGTFRHNYTDFGLAGCCWDGWTYSNRTGNVVPGVTSQYNAFAGSGADGSANYGVAFAGAADAPAITFLTPVTVAGGYFTNNTYAALSMLLGDSFAKKFGGASGNDEDFFKLRITGKDAAGSTTGSVDFYLADYRFADNSRDYIVSGWRFVDLAGLGTVQRLEFALDSSDVGSFGPNTPLYFALDNLAVTPIPEPAAAALLLAGLALTIGVAQRRRRKA